MKCDLHTRFGELARTLPTGEGEKCAFNSQTFPDSQDDLVSDQLVIRKRYHYYDDFRVDTLAFFALKPTYQEFGLLILSAVFRPSGRRIRLELTDPTSDVTHLLVEYGGRTTRGLGYSTRPEEFVFSPSRRVEIHPWTHHLADLPDLPRFRLTNLKQFVVTEEDWACRDTVMGFGSDEASIMLADLLLRFGSTQNETNEVALEGEGGFRGVGLYSAEASFYLPGSLAWPPEPPPLFTLAGERR